MESKSNKMSHASLKSCCKKKIAQMSFPDFILGRRACLADCGWSLQNFVCSTSVSESSKVIYNSFYHFLDLASSPDIILYSSNQKSNQSRSCDNLHFFLPLLAVLLLCVAKRQKLLPILNFEHEIPT